MACATLDERTRAALVGRHSPDCRRLLFIASLSLGIIIGFACFVSANGWLTQCD